VQRGHGVFPRGCLQRPDQGSAGPFTITFAIVGPLEHLAATRRNRKIHMTAAEGMTHSEATDGPERIFQRASAMMDGRDMNMHHVTRSSLCRQFVSHVLPSSDEKACSQRAEVGVICDQVNRTLIGLPLRVSLA
jgi:hypothetical protein